MPSLARRKTPRIDAERPSYLTRTTPPAPRKSRAPTPSQRHPSQPAIARMTRLTTRNLPASSRRRGREQSSTPRAAEEKSRQKSLKQSQAAKADFDSFDEKLSAPSSTAGVDADDDQSPTLSPQVTAADAGDVSDMLEPAPAGPSILRIVDTDKVKQAPPKKAKEAEVAETKKQRQNRKKREAEKELREEAEKERKKMEEAQRRTARIARGEAAKDGSQFMARVNGANKASAWTAGPPNGGSSSSNSGSQPGPDGFVDTQPLDTFDPTAAPANGQGQSLADSWISELPSEEEQLKKLQEETEEWSTVVTKSQKRGAKKYASSEKSDATDPANVVAAAAAPPPAASRTAPGPAPQQKPVNGKGARTLQSFGSFSALSTNEEEKETEWEL